MKLIKAEDQVCIGWRYENSQFIEPEQQRAEPTPEQIQQANEAQKAHLLTLASGKIAVLQDAADLNMATDQEMALLKKWQIFRILASRLEVCAEKMIVPELPE